MIPLKFPEIGSCRSIYFFRFMYLKEYILHIGEAKVSKSEFIDTLSESKSIFAIQKRPLFHPLSKMFHFLLDLKYAFTQMVTPVFLL